jgi:hypothetical protein
VAVRGAYSYLQHLPSGFSVGDSFIQLQGGGTNVRNDVSTPRDNAIQKGRKYENEFLRKYGAEGVQWLDFVKKTMDHRVS